MTGARRSRSRNRAEPRGVPKRTGTDIRIKRVYEPSAPGDGVRVLVDRLWPRGLSKTEARVDLWLKGLAPSDSLRRWFAHDPAKWSEFRRRYFEELAAKQEEVTELARLARRRRLTLLYAARDERHNNAVALASYLRGAAGARRHGNAARSRALSGPHDRGSARHGAARGGGHGPRVSG